jgi:hypothetical protein
MASIGLLIVRDDHLLGLSLSRPKFGTSGGEAKMLRPARTSSAPSRAQIVQQGAGDGTSVLIVDADGEDQSRLARMLAVRGHRVIGAPTLDAARVLLSSCPVDLLLLSEDTLGVAAPELVANLQAECPGCLAVVMTGTDEASSGVRPARFETQAAALRRL